MKNYLHLLLCFVIILSCDDGDILTVELDFDKDLSLCDDGESYLLFDTKNDPSEALLLFFPINGNESIFAANSLTTITQENLENFLIPEVDSLRISDSNVRFIYRTYNRNLTDNDLCDIVSPADLVITSSNEASTGTVQIITSFVDDDFDDIPTVDEDPNTDGDNNPATNALDSDNDGIPNYLDRDDDGDNVLTSDELDTTNDDGDNNPLTSPLDTDNDGIPNYLDTDDDGDGTPTRSEDAANDGPTNDLVFDNDGNQIARYLYSNENENFGERSPFENQYTRTYTTTFTILNTGLNIINATEINFGTIESGFNVTATPAN